MFRSIDTKSQIFLSDSRSFTWTEILNYTVNSIQPQTSTIFVCPCMVLPPLALGSLYDTHTCTHSLHTPTPNTHLQPPPHTHTHTLTHTVTTSTVNCKCSTINFSTL